MAGDLEKRFAALWDGVPSILLDKSIRYVDDDSSSPRTSTPTPSSRKVSLFLDNLIVQLLEAPPLPRAGPDLFLKERTRAVQDLKDLTESHLAQNGCTSAAGGRRPSHHGAGHAFDVVKRAFTALEAELPPLPVLQKRLRR